RSYLPESSAFSTSAWLSTTFVLWPAAVRVASTWNSFSAAGTREVGFMKTRTRDGYFDRITRAPPPIKTNLSPQPDTTPGRETRAPTKIAAAPTIRLLIVPPAICRPVYASIPDPSSRIPIRNRSVRFVLGSLPPEFPKLGRLEILQVGEEVVGIE